MTSKSKTDVERIEWPRRYVTALRRFLRREKTGSLLQAAGLGHDAVSLGMESLDVALVHEQTLNEAMPPEEAHGNAGQERRETSDIFFQETIAPIEATHSAARKADMRIDQLTRTLQQRAAESCVSDEQLEQAIAERKAAEASADAHAASHDRLLAEAQRMQTHLRDRMHAILSEQEGERKRLSVELCDEIAQALLAVDLSLLALKASGPVNLEKTEKSIADAHRILKDLETRGHVSSDR